MRRAALALVLGMLGCFDLGELSNRYDAGGGDGEVISTSCSLSDPLGPVLDPVVAGSTPGLAAVGNGRFVVLGIGDTTTHMVRYDIAGGSKVGPEIPCGAMQSCSRARVARTTATGSYHVVFENSAASVQWYDIPNDLTSVSTPHFGDSCSAVAGVDVVDDTAHVVIVEGCPGFHLFDDAGNHIGSSSSLTQEVRIARAATAPALNYVGYTIPSQGTTVARLTWLSPTAAVPTLTAVSPVVTQDVLAGLAVDLSPIGDRVMVAGVIDNAVKLVELDVGSSSNLAAPPAMGPAIASSSAPIGLAYGTDWAVVTYRDPSGAGWAVPFRPGTADAPIPLAIGAAAGGAVSGPQVAWDPAPPGTKGTFLIAYVVDTKVWVRTLTCP